MHCTTSARIQDKFTTSSLTSQETCNNECHTNVFQNCKGKFSSNNFPKGFFTRNFFMHKIFMQGFLGRDNTLSSSMTVCLSLLETGEKPQGRNENSNKEFVYWVSHASRKKQTSTRKNNSTTSELTRSSFYLK